MVGVHDGAVGRLATPDRHLQRVDDELRAEVVRERPADHAPGPGVEHDREIDLAGAGRVFRDVAHPERVWRVDAELPVDEIVGRDGAEVSAGAAPPPAAIHALDSRRAHQPGDAFASHLDASTEAQLGVHPRAAVGAPALAVDLDDRRRQGMILTHPRRGVTLTLAPFVEAGGRHLHHTATRRDRQVRAALGDEGEPHFGTTFSLAKYAAARLRISTSISSVRFSRRSFTSSARSSLVIPSRRP